jgi:hypothetical protein
MSKLVLIIKAETFVQAKEAANARGIHLTDLCVINPKEFRARTDDKNTARVQKWFLEPGICRTGTGYPIGTLLFFRYNQD